MCEFDRIKALYDLKRALESYDDFEESGGAVFDPPERIEVEGHYLKDAVIAVQQCCDDKRLPRSVLSAWHRLTHLSRRHYQGINEIREAVAQAIDCVYIMGEWVENELERQTLSVHLGRNVALIEGTEYQVEPHHAQMLNALVEAKQCGEWWVTGPKMTDLRACHGKKIDRVFKELKDRIPVLSTLLESGGPKGYRLRK